MTNNDGRTVAVIGLGVMGSQAAGALVAAGLRVVGYDIAPDARERAAAAGVSVTHDARGAAAEASIVLLSLPTPADTLEVVTAVAGAGVVVLVADLSTIDPATARQAAKTLAAAGSRYVDSPVLGRPAGVGGWTLPTGGNEADVAQLREVAVGTIAKAVEHVGEVGSGSAVKVLNNAMFGAINAITAEVLDLADRFGLPPARFAEVVADSGAATASPLFKDVAPRMAKRDHSVVFRLDLLQKDLRLGTSLARDLEAPAEMLDVVEGLTSAAVESGHGQDDTSSLIELYFERRVPR